MADFDDYIDAFRDTGTPTRLAECSSCGRTFNPTALGRHAKVCQGQKKRKPFDSSKQRNSDVPKDFVKKPTKTQSELAAGGKKSNWREKHEEFVNNLRAARGVASAQKTGGPLPPPPPPAANPDYVQCPHCSRRFNEHAAERHIPFCKEQKSRLANSSSAKSGSLAKRTQYKPPLPGKRTSTGSATTVSSAGKTRQVASAKTKSDLDFSSPGQSSGYGSRQPLASPSSRRKQVPNASPMATRKGHSSPSQQRNKDMNGTYSGRARSSERNQHLFDSDEETSPATQIREARYGRRSSQSNGNTDNSGGRGGSGSRYSRPSSDYSDVSDRISSSSSSGQRNRCESGIFYQVNQISCCICMSNFFFARHIALRDPSPTFFDDFGFDSNSPSPPMDHTPVSSRERLQETASHSTRRGQREGSAGKKLSKFCHECGTKYPVENAKFCCECGMRRLYIDLT